MGTYEAQIGNYIKTQEGIIEESNITIEYLEKSIELFKARIKLEKENINLAKITIDSTLR